MPENLQRADDGSVLERLQKVAAPEFNYLLTEPPFRTADGADFGWYCREHAFCTHAVAALLGMRCRIVSGDFIVLVQGNKRLSSIDTGSGHAWCTSRSSPVLDLSLHFREFGPGPQLTEPIVRLGRNGIFDVRILPLETRFDALFDTSIVGYIPRHEFKWTAVELADNPSHFLPTREAAEISARIAVHTFAVMSGERASLIGTLNQADALAALRSTFPQPLGALRERLTR